MTLLHVGQGGQPGERVGGDGACVPLPSLCLHPPHPEGAWQPGITTIQLEVDRRAITNIYVLNILHAS